MADQKKTVRNPNKRGTKALQEIRKYQRLEGLPLKPRKVPFRELVAGVIQDVRARNPLLFAEPRTEKLK
jgi:hypothetical protein